PLQRLPILSLFPYTTLFRSLRTTGKRNFLRCHNDETKHFCARRNSKFNPGGEKFAPLGWKLFALILLNVAKSTSLDLILGKNGRSEEHTSELQSRENLVCRL